MTKASANGVSPYLPLKLDPVVELEIERLVSITQLPALTKPYHIATVNRYLDKVQMSHPQLHQRLVAYIKRYKQKKALTHFSAELSVNSGENFTLINSRGQQADDSYRVSMTSFYQLNKHAIFNTGGTAYQGEIVPHNTFISLGWDAFQVDLGYREHWMAPHHESSLLLSTQAKPALSLTMSNVTPFTDWNIKYEMSVGMLKEMDNILYKDEKFSGKPGFLTMHLSAQLFDWWTIGGNRTMMFGGGKRDVTFKDVWNAIIDPVNSDNCGGDGTDLQDCDEEVGNQIASITSRFDFAIGEFPVSLYIDYGGEDTANYKATKFGNIGQNYGVFLPYLTKNTSLSLEWAKYHRLWYIHHIYGEGYTNDGNVMGHWWGDTKLPNDPSSGEALSAKVTWDDGDKFSVIAQYRSESFDQEVNSKADYERSHVLDIKVNYLVGKSFWGVNLTGGKDALGESFFRTSVSYMW